MTQREIFKKELERLEKARKAAESSYLKADYSKAIRRMRKDLQQYDKYRTEAGA